MTGDATRIDATAADSVCDAPGGSAPDAATAARRTLRDSALAVVLLATVIGGAVGLGVALLHHAVLWLQATAFGLAHDVRLGEVRPADTLRLFAVPVVGGLLLGLLTWAARRLNRRETVDPIEANALYGGKMSLVDSARLTLHTLVSNGAGASVGMEAAYTQSGSGLASAIGQRLRLRRGDLRTLVGCGAAAAIAAAYGAPLAGAFYAFELVLGAYTLPVLAPVGAASVAAAAASQWFEGPGLPMAFRDGGIIDGTDFALCAAVGFLGGWLAIGAMQAVSLSERVFRALPGPSWIRPALGGLGVGAVAWFAPAVLGAGPGAAPPELAGSVAALTALLAAKILASALSLGSGFRGGLFSASLFMGGLFGSVLAELATRLAPGLEFDATLLTLVGMGSVAAGIVGAPVTMVLLVLESTQDLWAASGVLIGVVLSATVVRHAFGYSFATWRFHLKGVPIRGAQDVGWVRELSAARLMRRDAVVVPATLPVDELRRRHPLGSAKQVFAVDASGRYVGQVDMALVHAPGAAGDEDAGRTVGDMAAAPDGFLLGNDDAQTAFHRFCTAEMETLPVLSDREARRVIGYVTEAFLLRRYSQELERIRAAETGDHGLFGRD